MLGGRTPDAAHPHPSRACRPGVTAAGELDLRQTGNLMRFTIAVNFCGLPAVSVPVGHSSQGAPRLLPGCAPAYPRMRPRFSQGASRLLPGCASAPPGARPGMGCAGAPRGRGQRDSSSHAWFWPAAAHAYTALDSPQPCERLL